MTTFHRPPRPGLLSGHVASRLALATFACALALAFAATAAGFVWLRGGLVESLASETSAVVRGAIDPRDYPTLDELVRTGEHLVRRGHIVGGTFVTGIGAERASFGDPPELTWAEARLEGTRWRSGLRQGTFETFITPQEVGLGYGLLVKVRAESRWQALLERLSVLFSIGLIAATVLAVAVGLIARRLVARRLAAIEGAVAAGLSAPGEAGRRLSRLQGGDEIALVSRQTDRLLTLLSTLINEDLAAAHAVIERCPFALVMIAPDGRIAQANEPALRLFDVPGLDELPRGDSATLCLFEGEPMSPARLLARGSLHGPGEVVLPELTVPVCVGVEAMHGPDGALLGCFVMLIDVRDMVADMRRQVALREEARERQRRAEIELARLRAQLEACLVILEHERGGQPPQFPVTVDPGPLVEGWLDKAVGRGEMAPRGVIHQTLPLLRVDPDGARRLFQFLFEAVRRRSGQPTPTILVTGSHDGGAACLTVRATAASSRTLCEPIAADNQSTLLIGAIAVLAASLGGRLAAERIGEAGNGITVLLPLETASAAPGETAEAAASAA